MPLGSAIGGVRAAFDITQNEQRLKQDSRALDQADQRLDLRRKEFEQSQEAATGLKLKDRVADTKAAVAGIVADIISNTKAFKNNPDPKITDGLARASARALEFLEMRDAETKAAYNSVGLQAPQSSLVAPTVKIQLENAFTDRQRTVSEARAKAEATEIGTPAQAELAGAKATAAREPIANAAQRAGAVARAQESEKVAGSTTIAKLQTERDAAVAQQRPEDAKQLQNRIEVLSTVTGRTEFDLGARDQSNFIDKQVAALDSIDTIDRMKQQLASGEVFTGIVSGAVRGLASLRGSLVQTASAFGFDDTSLLDPKRYEFEKFGSAAQSAAFKANVVDLAYSLARAKDSGRLSDRDVQLRIDQMAADSGDKELMVASLSEIQRGIQSGIINLHSVLKSTGAAIPDLHPRLESETAPTVGNAEAAAQAPVGSVATFADGRRYVKQPNGSWLEAGSQ